MIGEISLALNSKANYLYFMPTSRCNAFCDFCWNWENVADAGKLYKPGAPIKRKEMTLEEIEQFTINLPRMLLVNLFGGEPFIREDLKEIIALFVINTKVKYISIPTNGYYTEKILDDVESSLKRFPQTFFRLYISVDGPEKIHNRIRKLKDGYQRAMSTADQLIELKKTYKNLCISINANYNADTQEIMSEYVDELLERDKYDAINVNLVRGNPYDPKLLEVKVPRFFEIQDKIRKKRKNSDQPFSVLHQTIEEKTTEIIKDSIYNPGPRKFNCFALKKITVVTDQGDVLACEEMLDNIVGNLRDYNYSLEQVLKSPKAKELRKSIVDRKCNCRYECAINTSSVFDAKEYPRLVAKVAQKVLS